MHLDFSDKKLLEICSKKQVAEKKLGADSAKKLRARLADLEAAHNVGELVAGSPHPLKHDRKGQFAVSLAHGHRLVFVPNNDPIPLDLYGNTDWSNVTAITIVFIGDYHG